jgi:MraZ protein
MAEAFRGEFYQRVDGKARVLIPVAFRRILEAGHPGREDRGPEVTMVFGGRKRQFVECYSKAGADTLAARIEAMDLGSEERDRAELHLISRSATVDVDGDGRVVLPPRVRQKLALDGAVPADAEVVMVGSTNRFKIFRRDVYDALMAEEDDDDTDPLTLVGRAGRSG